MSENRIIKFVCKNCKSNFYQYNRKNRPQLFCSRKCFNESGHQSKQITGRNKGKKNGNWSGKNVTYIGVHEWIYRELGKAKKCEYKLCKYPRKNTAYHILLSPKSFHWANKSHKYFRKLSDWVSLCPSCHARYDRGLIKLT